MSKEEKTSEFEKETENVLSITLRGLAEGLTGIAASSKKELVLSVSHTFQRMRGGQFLSVLLEEWKKYREKGKVKDDYQFTEQHKVCLQELLDFLDNDSPDELRFKILKKIFLVAASEEVSNRDSLLPQQYMKIARRLSDGEIISLSTVYNIFKNGKWKNERHYSASRWISEVTEASGLQHPELVEIHEHSLMNKKLLTPRQLADGSGVNINPYYRLSKLGYEFCKYIESYEE